jgi:cell wall-associated NlpC family hydrolase
LDLLGIRYRRGGSSPESGFDCSGFVNHVFREGLGLMLPRSSKEMSKSGEFVAKDELRPGDLVFFNTMRSAFSHVGIYLGDNQFVHAPRAGGRVRIEDLRESYWIKRFNGARRINPA